MTSSESADRLGLPSALHEAAKLSGKPVPNGHRRIYAYAVEGRIPAELDHGRWYVRRSDLPAVMAALGLTLEAAA